MGMPESSEPLRNERVSEVSQSGLTHDFVPPLLVGLLFVVESLSMEDLMESE